MTAGEDETPEGSLSGFTKRRAYFHCVIDFEMDSIKGSKISSVQHNLI